jgi:hypothetical protein
MAYLELLVERMNLTGRVSPSAHTKTKQHNTTTKHITEQHNNKRTIRKTKTDKERAQYSGHTVHRRHIQRIINVQTRSDC